MTPLRRTAEDESGAFLIILVLSISVFFGFLALTIDVGGTLSLRRTLVKAADAAALAGAQACADDESASAVSSIVTSYATDNLNDPAGLTMTHTGCGSDNKITVTLTKNHALDFGPLVGGGESTTVSARGTAQWGGALAGPPQPFGLAAVAWDDCFGSDPPPEVGDTCTFQTNMRGDSGQGHGPGGSGPPVNVPGPAVTPPGPRVTPPGGGPPGVTPSPSVTPSPTTSAAPLTSSNEWGGLNLDTWGIKTIPTNEAVDCPNRDVGSGSAAWVPKGYFKDLTVTDPTYVCPDGGLSFGVSWRKLLLDPPLGPRGTTQIFAVLDDRGLLASPQGDRYKVLGITKLEVVDVSQPTLGAQVTITLRWLGFQLTPGLPGGPSSFGLSSVALVPNP